MLLDQLKARNSYCTSALDGVSRRRVTLLSVALVHVGRELACGTCLGKLILKRGSFINRGSHEIFRYMAAELLICIETESQTARSLQ